jgi:hypothetical protein
LIECGSSLLLEPETCLRWRARQQAGTRESGSFATDHAVHGFAAAAQSAWHIFIYRGEPQARGILWWDLLTESRRQAGKKFRQVVANSKKSAIFEKIFPYR